ncbi:MAG: transposase [Thermotaleaceae bacterium]
MPRQKRKKSKSGYYHIMLRGNERRNIFYAEEDKQRFIEILQSKKKDGRYTLHAFCLMDNHLHLLLSEGSEEIGTIMKRITVSYVYYFNKKYKRVGHLFQDRFRSETVEDDRQVVSLTRYIHQNPVKAGLSKKPGDYKWSSYGAYIHNGSYFATIVDTDVVLGLFSNNQEAAKKLFQQYMKETSEDVFIDLEEPKEALGEEEAKGLYKNMLLEWNLDEQDSIRAKLSREFIQAFKEKSNLSIRRIAELTGLNKDKISSMLKE